MRAKRGIRELDQAISEAERDVLGCVRPQQSINGSSPTQSDKLTRVFFCTIPLPSSATQLKVSVSCS